LVETLHRLVARYVAELGFACRHDFLREKFLEFPSVGSLRSVAEARAVEEPVQKDFVAVGLQTAQFFGEPRLLRERGSPMKIRHHQKRGLGADCVTSLERQIDFGFPSW